MNLRRLLLSVVLVGGLCVAAGGESGSDVEYMAVFIGGQKAGHVIHTRTVTDGKVTTREQMQLTIKRMGVEMTIRQVEQSVETAKGRPLSFGSLQDMGIMSQQIDGTVGPDGKVKATVSSGTRKSERTLDWPKGALMSEGLRLLSLSKGLKQGTKYTATAFSPGLMTALPVEVAVGAKKSVDLLGRVVKLTEVKTVMSGPTGRIESTGYVDEEGNALKTIVPMLGMKLEMVSCSKAVALSPADPLDFFEKVVVASPEPLTGVRTAKSATYRIEPTSGKAKLSFLSSPSQKFTAAKAGASTVTVRPAKGAEGTPVRYAGTDAAAKEALKPTRYLQCDRPEIARLAKEAVGDAPDAAGAAKRIEQFVGKFITDKNLSVGYATAAEVADSKQGDCTEHAVLAAAMCRAIGLPAQVVTGVAYVKRLGTKRDVFVPHAWYRVLIGGKWIDYDAALRGYDAGHLAMSAGAGDPEEFFGILGTMGYFKIVGVSLRR